jgi:hypothetical protein
MAQITIYLPDEIEKKVKDEAKRARLSVSAYISSLATHRLKPRRLPENFADLYGSWEGEFPEIEDRAPEEREAL